MEFLSDVDECTLPSSPCKNGAECTNSLGEYSCQCSAGWTGADCDIGKLFFIVTVLKILEGINESESD